MSTGRGRWDQATSVVAWQTKANLSLLGLGVGIVMVWHLAAWVTSAGLGWFEVVATIKSLVRLRPFTSERVDTATDGMVGVTFAVLVAVVVGAYFAWYGHRRGKFHDSGAISGPSPYDVPRRLPVGALFRVHPGTEGPRWGRR